MKPISRSRNVTLMVLAAAMIILSAAGICVFNRDSRLARTNMKQAQNEYQRAEYDQALSHYMCALQYDDTLVEAYRTIADIYLEKSSYKEALRILAEGAEKTQDAALAERAAYLNEHIAMTGWTCSKDGKLIAEAAFDLSGRPTKIITYRDGNIASQNEYTYDAAGNQTKSIVIEYNSDGDTEKRTESEWAYDAAGAVTEYAYEAAAYFNAGSIGSCRGETFCKTGRKTKWVYYGGEENKIVEWYEDEYDIDGNHIRETEYDEDGEIVKILEYEYNENGGETKSVSYNGNGVADYWYRTEYDEKGNFIQCVYHNGDQSTIYEECTYDSSGNKLKYTQYDWNGDLVERAEWEYDDAGNQTKYRYYDKTGQLENWSECEYDADGNKTSYISYNSDGSVEERSDWIYDESGNEIESTYSVRGNIAYRWKYEYGKAGSVVRKSFYSKLSNKIEEWEYDDSGNEIKYTSSRNGEFDYWEECVYDKTGNVISKITYDEDGSISQSEEWAYDDSGNLLKYLRYDEMFRLAEQKSWEYDRDGAEIRRYDCRYDQNGSLSEWSDHENKYDADGMQLESVGHEKTKDGGYRTTFEKYNGDYRLQELTFYDFACTEQEYFDAVSGNAFEDSSEYIFICEYCLVNGF